MPLTAALFSLRWSLVIQSIQLGWAMTGDALVERYFNDPNRLLG
ncbi:MAG TPA: hypothetical protein VJ821_09060 [Anaerolineales bacterium]|nr:hypothetical protein [Anaerolineales bacterium]